LAPFASNLQTKFASDGKIRRLFRRKFYKVKSHKFLSQNASRKAVNLSPKCSNLQNKEQARSKPKQRKVKSNGINRRSHASPSPRKTAAGNALIVA
jgi:hypothetical protein